MGIEPTAPGRRVGAQELLLAVPWLLVALALARGHTGRAALLAVVALALLITRIAVGPDRFRAGLHRVGRRVERGLSTVGSALVWAVAVVPAWAIGRIGRRRAGTATWVTVRRGATPRRPFGRAPAASGHRPLTRALAAVGVVVVLLVVNLLVGLAWERIAGTDTEPLSARLGVTTRNAQVDPRVDGVALRDEPWAATHLADLQQAPGGYWPYLLTWAGDYTSETITIRDWERLSYRTPGPAEGRPTVMFLGGSAMFGEGQRDEHTIASEVARLAEADGLPITAVNVGQRGWVSWQEMLFFEQRTATDAPDVAVFYDGGNDVATQLQPSTAGYPTHYDVDRVARRITGTGVAGQPSTATEPSGLEQAVDDYRSHSAVHKLARFLRAAVAGEPTDPADDEPEPEPEVTTRDEVAIGTDAAELYQRARALSTDIAERRGIETLFFWQPMRDRAVDEAYATATDLVGPPTIDISEELIDDPEVFLDAVHTNEEGARLVAERIWEDLRPLVAELTAGR